MIMTMLAYYVINIVLQYIPVLWYFKRRQQLDLNNYTYSFKMNIKVLNMCQTCLLIIKT